METLKQEQEQKQKQKEEEMIIECLYKLSDVKQEEFEKLKIDYLKNGQSQLLCRQLAGRSVLPRMRNTQRPPGEVYAPIYYNEDYMVKLVHKPGWGGHIIALTIWNLLVIDIDVDENDDEDPLIYIEKNILKLYPNDLFYINKTNRGYHVYLVSRTIRHSSKAAIYMRIKMNSDPAHGTNSLYAGSSLRLNKKITDRTNIPSEYYTQYGNGVADPKALELYNTVQSYIKKFGQYQVDEIISNQDLMRELYTTWQKTQAEHDDFGLRQIVASAPMMLCDINGIIKTRKSPAFEIYGTPWEDLIRMRWTQFLKYRVLRPMEAPVILIGAQHHMGMNNLYRIFEATPDYAIGVHVQESCYFISYRDLLFIDYDHKNRLQILHQYVRYHPEATFRVVRTNKGYHAFLTSYPVPYQNCLDLSLRLCTDPCHLLSVYHRGYSVRVNQKFKKEKPYKEIRKIGKAEEDPRLYQLYLKYLELNKENCERKKEVYLYQSQTSRKIVEDEGYLPHKSIPSSADGVI